MKLYTLIYNAPEETSSNLHLSYRDALEDVASTYGIEFDETLDDKALEAFLDGEVPCRFYVQETELPAGFATTFGDYALGGPTGDKVEIARADGSRVSVPADLIVRGITDAIDAGGEEIEEQAEEPSADEPALKRYFVHRYDVIRVKVAVEAASQQDAMTKADEFLRDNYPLRDWEANRSAEEDVLHVMNRFSTLPLALAYAHAEETTGYLVDEVGDSEYENSVQYDHNMQLADGNPARVKLAAPADEGDGSIVLTFGPCSMPENVNDPEECFASMAGELETRLNGEAFEIIKELAEENGFINDDEGDEEE
ncbi:hypothetical protein [Erythrobacter aureus]|uniref:hypothetical protein n=1 Tax=Erythrobacter aureus TaxID=2182384 RepID=UPI0015AF7A46|nr:hypothetical protein [Erythrobacter aureus]